MRSEIKKKTDIAVAHSRVKCEHKLFQILISNTVIYSTPSHMEALHKLLHATQAYQQSVQIRLETRVFSEVWVKTHEMI